MNPIVIIPSNLDELEQMARTVGQGMFPGLSTWNQVATVIAMGMELGLSPMMSLRNIRLTKHGVSLSADIMVAVCLASSHCEYFELIESSNEQATFRTKRSDRDEKSLTYTLDEARQAGLYTDEQLKSSKGFEYKSTWQAHTKKMLEARCKAFLARLVYPDVVAGFYTPDEMAEVAEKRRSEKEAREAEAEAERARQMAQKAVQEAEDDRSVSKKLDKILTTYQRSWFDVVCHGLDIEKREDRKTAVALIEGAIHKDEATGVDLRNRLYLRGAALKWGQENCQKACQGIDRRTPEGRMQAVEALYKSFHGSDSSGGENCHEAASQPAQGDAGPATQDGSTDFVPEKPNGWARGKDPVQDAALDILEKAMRRTGTTWEDVCADCREIFDFPSPYYLRAKRIEQLTSLVLKYEQEEPPPDQGSPPRREDPPDNGESFVGPFDEDGKGSELA